MNPDSMEKFCEMIYVYGGLPVGTLTDWHESHVEIRPSMPAAIFMDITHDNEVPAQKVEDILFITTDPLTLE